MMILKNLFVILLFCSSTAGAQNFTPVDNGSKIHFIIKNFGINTGGDFTGLKGKIHFLTYNIEASGFEVTVNASTIDTDNSIRDESLAGDEYFDATKFPVIKIVSTKISKTNKTAAGFYYFTGSLTIKGITKPIAFPFQVKKINDNYLFSGNFVIDRTAFNVGEKNIVLSNSVSVSLSVLAQKD